MTNEAPCAGQLHGHDFPYPGANCLKCGINQNVMSGQGVREGHSSLSAFANFKPTIRQPTRGVHTELQALVSETRNRFGETAKKGKGSFGFYMGFFKRLGIERVRMFLAETKDGNNPKVLFWWKVGQYYKEKKSKS